MADRTLRNVATMSGSYNDTPFANSDSTAISLLVPEISFAKTADQTIWMDGTLIFTLTIDNTDSEGALTNLVITDQLDITAFAYNENSVTVTIGGTATTNFTATYLPTGLLTITLTDPVPIGSTAVITFSGEKVHV